MQLRGGTFAQRVELTGSDDLVSIKVPEHVVHQLNACLLTSTCSHILRLDAGMLRSRVADGWAEILQPYLMVLPLSLLKYHTVSVELLYKEGITPVALHRVCLDVQPAEAALPDSARPHTIKYWLPGAERRQVALNLASGMGAVDYGWRPGAWDSFYSAPDLRVLETPPIEAPAARLAGGRR